jgi:hypothetical protein
MRHLLIRPDRLEINLQSADERYKVLTSAGAAAVTTPNVALQPTVDFGVCQDHRRYRCGEVGASTGGSGNCLRNSLRIPREDLLHATCAAGLFLAPLKMPKHESDPSRMIAQAKTVIEVGIVPPSTTQDLER